MFGHNPSRAFVAFSFPSAVFALSFQKMPVLPTCRAVLRPSGFHLFDELSPFFSTPCALFCAFLHFCKIQLLCFHAIPHSLAKTRGVGDTDSFLKRLNVTPPNCVFSTPSLLYPFSFVPRSHSCLSEELTSVLP